jgi:hypothetical protein
VTAGAAHAPGFAFHAERAAAAVVVALDERTRKRRIEKELLTKRARGGIVRDAIARVDVGRRGVVVERGKRGGSSRRRDRRIAFASRPTRGARKNDA